ncbi:MAG: hypothetical protein Q8K75_04650 [Chlamydiales bacterium]|nr:hypothetical protein [Chlamydiales bacterium]
MSNINASNSIKNIERIEILLQEGGVQNHAKASLEVVKLAMNNLRDVGVHTYDTFASLGIAWKEGRLSIATNHAVRAFQYSLQFFSNSVALFVPVTAVKAAKIIGTTTVWNSPMPRGLKGKTKFWLQQTVSAGKKIASQVVSHPQGMLAVKAVASLAAVGTAGVVTQRLLGGTAPDIVPDPSPLFNPMALVLGALGITTLCVVGGGVAYSRANVPVIPAPGAAVIPAPSWNFNDILQNFPQGGQQGLQQAGAGIAPPAETPEAIKLRINQELAPHRELLQRTYDLLSNDGGDFTNNDLLTVIGVELTRVLDDTYTYRDQLGNQDIRDALALMLNVPHVDNYYIGRINEFLAAPIPAIEPPPAPQPNPAELGQGEPIPGVQDPLLDDPLDLEPADLEIVRVEPPPVQAPIEDAVSYAMQEIFAILELELEDELDRNIALLEGQLQDVYRMRHTEENNRLIHNEKLRGFLSFLAGKQVVQDSPDLLEAIRLFLSGSNIAGKSLGDTLNRAQDENRISKAVALEILRDALAQLQAEAE